MAEHPHPHRRGTRRSEELDVARGEAVAIERPGRRELAPPPQQIARAAHALPFRGGAIDEVSLRRLVRHYASGPIDGFILAATSGEGWLELSRLTKSDVAFGEVAVRAAVAAIRRAQALETTRADNRRLEALATTDPLTRVLNRRALLDRLTAEVDRARRYDSGLTMLLLDVDYFKQINDTAGHLAGDSVLRQLGALLEDAMRKVDVVARYGGEEFVAILPETSAEGGVAFAERLRERSTKTQPCHSRTSTGRRPYAALSNPSTSLNPGAPISWPSNPYVQAWYGHTIAFGSDDPPQGSSS